MTFVYVLICILLLAILILVHEFGHFFTAKLCNVKVEEFSLGMGPAIWKKQKGETLYALRCIPFGGYCALAGENDESDDPRAFLNQPRWKKLLILSAGIIMNLLLGFLILAGITLPMKVVETPYIADFAPGVTYNNEEGLQVGDRFWKIDGHRIYFYSDISFFLGIDDDIYDLVVLRDGEKVELKQIQLKYQVYEGDERPSHGLRMGFETERATFGKKLGYAWDATKSYGRIVWMGLKMLVKGQVGLKDMGGPVAIVDMAVESGKQSESFGLAMINILDLFALVAINLAIMNALPIPALDGGRIFLLLVTAPIEWITGKKLNPKYEAYINAVGLILVLGLLVVVMFNDIARIVTR